MMELDKTAVSTVPRYLANLTSIKKQTNANLYLEEWFLYFLQSFIGELCVSCRKPILSAAFSKNIHTDDVKLNKLEKTIKINVAMEMIAGQKVLYKYFFE